MNAKTSSILMLIVVCGLTAALYAVLLSGLYNFGFWGIDLLVMILAELAIIGGITGIAGITNQSDITTQSVARWSVVRQAGIVVALLTLLHTIACIVSPVNIDVAYWVILGLVIVWFTVRLFLVHTGSMVQEQVESRQNAMHAQQKAVADTLHTPTVLLVGAIQGCNASQSIKLSAEDAVKTVSTIVDGLSMKRLNRNASLIGEIGKWSVRLVQLKNSLATEDATTTLQAIATEARAEAEIINNLYMQ